MYNKRVVNILLSNEAGSIKYDLKDIYPVTLSCGQAKIGLSGQLNWC